MKVSLLPRVFCAITVCCAGARAFAAPIDAPAEVPVLTADELAARVGGPTRVSLHLKNVKLSQAVDELARQAGLSVMREMPDYWAQSDPTVSLDVNDKPFWTTARLLTPPDLRLVWSTRADSGQVAVFPDVLEGATNAASPAIPLGVFSLVAFSLDVGGARPLHWDFRGQPEKSDDQATLLRLKLLADPKLALAANGFWPASGFYQWDEISDDTGANLLLEPNAKPVAFDTINFPAFTLQAKLRAPAPAARRLAKVSGHFSFLIVTQTENWEVSVEQGTAEASHSVEMVGSGAHEFAVSVAPFGKDNDNFDVHLRHKSGAELPFDLQRLPMTALRLEDAQQRALWGRFTGQGSEDWAANYALSVRPVGAPARLVVQIPTALSRVEVPFTMNLPLPAAP